MCPVVLLKFMCQVSHAVSRRARFDGENVVHINQLDMASCKVMRHGEETYRDARSRPAAGRRCGLMTPKVYFCVIHRVVHNVGQNSLESGRNVRRADRSVGSYLMGRWIMYQLQPAGRSG